MGTTKTPPSTTPPVVTLSATQPQSVDQGEAINLTASVANDPANSGVTWTLTCTSSACGTLSGQTAMSVTYTAPASVSANAAGILTATSLANSSVSSSIMVTAVPPPGIPIGPGTANGAGAPAGMQGVAYSYALQVNGGVAPYSWSVTSGALPPGVTLNATTGAIFGTPTVPGNYSPTVTVKDSGNPAKTASVPLSFAVTPPPGPITITTSSLGSATENAMYSVSLAATGGTGVYQWTLAAGSLPFGITLSTAGVLSGTPSTPGTYPMTFAVQDNAVPPDSASVSLTLKVNPPGPLTILTTSLPDAALGSPYQVQLQATIGDGINEWSVASGSSLPPSLTLSDQGLITGMPTAGGTYSFTVQVGAQGNQQFQSASKTLSLTVAPLSGTNNSQLNGHYAFSLFGGVEGLECAASMVGSFIADGMGNITQGEYDSSVCGTPTASHAFTGTYAVGADQRGKLVMTNIQNNQSTFAFSVSDIQGGIAQQAQFIEFDDTGGFKDIFANGVMQMQTPASFTTAALNGSYAYGLTGFTGAAGLFTFDGAGGITGPSVTGTYTAPDPLSGRVSFTVNSTSYVMYIIDAQSAYFANNGTPLDLAQIQIGMMRQQQSATFSNASLNGSVVAYAVPGGQPVIYALTADGVGNLTGTEYEGTGQVPFTTTYSVSSNGLVLLGNGDALWLYAPNAGFSTDSTSRTTPFLLTYESAAGGSFTFDFTTGISSITSAQSYLPALFSGEINGTYVPDGSGNVTTTLDSSLSQQSSISLTTTTNTVPIANPPYCGSGCTSTTLVPISSSRAVSIGNFDSFGSKILIFQK